MCLCIPYNPYIYLTTSLHWKGIGVNVSTYDHIISEYICINSGIKRAFGGRGSFENEEQNEWVDVNMNANSHTCVHVRVRACVSERKHAEIQFLTVITLSNYNTLICKLKQIEF